MSNSDRERENLSNIACISSLSSVPFYISCFLAFYLLTHTSSYDEDKSNIELTIWRCFLVSSRLFIWLLRVGHKCIYIYICMYARTFVLPSLSLPFSCVLPFVRSPTLVRTIKIDHFTAAAVTIYTYMYVYLSSPSFFPLLMTGSICGWRMRLSVRTELVHHHWTEQTHILLFFSQHTLQVFDSLSSVNSTTCIHFLLFFFIFSENKCIIII